MKGLAILGNLNWDLVFHGVSEWPGWGQEVFIDNATRIPGGIAHAAMAASALGTDVEIIGCVGRDQSGTELLTVLKNHGIGILSTLTTDAPTGLSAAIVKRDGERTYLTHQGALANASPFALWQQFVRDNHVVPNILLISGSPLIAPSSYEDWIRLITEAHDNNIQIALDLGWDPRQNWPFWHRILPLVDIVITNRLEATVYLDTSTLPGIVVIKSGATGATIIQQSKHTAIPGFPAQAIDTGGAGDVWNGAFFSSFIRQADVPEAALFANAAASLYVSKLSGTARYPNYAEVRRVILGHK